MRRITLAPATIAITIVFAAMLGGCSAQSNSDPKPEKTEKVEEQSTKAACLSLADASTEAGKAITDASGLLATDPAAAATEITEATSTFEDAVDNIENEEVRDAAAPLTLGLTHFAEGIEIFAADPVAENLDALTASSDEINNAYGAISEACG